MKKTIAIILVAVMLSMTGCTYSQTGIDALLQPPKLSQQQNDIYSALELSKGKNIKLKYPRKGDFKSAFLINNIDNEPTQEAIVFYEMANNAAATRPLRISVLDQEDGKWISTCEIGVEASEVEKVSFITTNQKIYIVIGFNLISKSEKLIKTYCYEDGILKEPLNVSLNEPQNILCSNYEVFDINGDNASELITITSKVSDREVKSVVANAYEITSEGMKVLDETQMDPKVSEYLNIYKGKLSNGVPAIYLDGLKGANLSTEILTMGKGGLNNLIYNHVDKLSIVDQTVRQYGTWTVDVNKDGVYDIPIVRPAPGYENVQKHQMEFFTDWYNYKDGKLVLIKTSYIDYNLGYIFTLPQKWIGKITIEVVIKDNEVIFYEYNKNNDEDKIELASIMAVKKRDFNKELKHDSYSILKDNGQLVYLYKLYDTKSKLAISKSDVENHFTLL